MSETGEPLLEYVDSRGVDLKVGNNGGVIEGVKILGLESKNGRVYPKKTLEKARELYEDAKVNVDHPAKGDKGSRSYADRIGMLRNTSLREDGLYGDLYYNPNHALAKQLEWDVQNAPENVGLSHNAFAATSRRGNTVVVEEIRKVNSVDLVADPATTRGLFEDTQPEEEEAEMADTPTLESLKADHPELVEAIGKQALDTFHASEEAKAEADKTKALIEELDAYKAKEKLEGEKSKVNTLIEDAKLPEVLVTETFTNQLLHADDETRVALIEDRKEMAGLATPPKGKPKSKDQDLSEGDENELDTKQVIKRITE